MQNDRNIKLKASPLFELGKELVNQKTTPEENPELAEKLAFIEQMEETALKRAIDEMEEQDITINIDNVSPKEKAQIRMLVSQVVNNLFAEERKFIGRAGRERVISDVTDEITGYGPIDAFIHDPEVSEIMVNGPKKVYIEKNGRILKTDVRFRGDHHVRHTIEKIISPLGRRLDDTSPMVDARLPDGSRVNAIIPPLVLNGPTLTIRKFAVEPYTVEDMIAFGTFTTEMTIFLKACVESRINIIVSGGTSSGKTTTLNVLSGFIPEEERIITIEDAAELQIRQEHNVRMESRPPNIEGKGTIAIRDLVINALRMRPDRIVVGEVRGGEALDMLQAMNTGHDGSITTGHANSPRDMLFRLETMVLMAGMDLPVRAVREQVSTAINLIVHQERFKDGTRKVTNITEVTGMEGDTVTLQDIFVFKQMGVDERNRVIGRRLPTGVVPKFITKMEAAGIYLPHQIFRNNGDEGWS